MLVVYGGSFNPFGRHHLAAVMWIAADPKVYQVLVVPAAAHASKTYTASFELRTQLIEASLPQDHKISVSKIERRMLDNGHVGPIYTYDMLKALQEDRHDGRPLKFAIGPDLVSEIPSWYLGDRVADDFGFYPLPDAGPGRSTTIRNLIAKSDPAWEIYMTEKAVNVLRTEPGGLDSYRVKFGPVEASFSHGCNT